MDLVVISKPRILPYRPRYRFAKRMLDLAFCILLLPILLPLMAFCVLAIVLTSSGGPFFVQERIGKGGRRFRMYKFRTMREDIDNSRHRTFMKAFVNGEMHDGEETHKPAQSSQITAVGRILRKTSLDELPQIYNVLKGDMSLVGPRPNMEWEVEEYQLWHHERLEVLPGITGLAQVQGRSDISFEAIVNYDIEYVLQQGFQMDLKILWLTLGTVFLGKGAG